MSSNNPDDTDEEGSQRADSVATGDAYDSPVNDPDGGNFSQFDAAAEDNITTDPSEVESTWTPTEGPDPSEMNTRVDFPDDPEINVDGVSTTTTDSEIDRDDVEGSKDSDTGESSDTEGADKREADIPPDENVDTTDTANTMDTMNNPESMATEPNDTPPESGDVPTETPQSVSKADADIDADVEEGVSPDTDSKTDENTPPAFEPQTGASAASATDSVDGGSVDTTEISSESSIDPPESTGQTEPSIKPTDRETQHTDPVDDVPLKHGDSFEEEPPSFVVEKTLVLLTVVVIAIAGWSLSLQFIANLPVPGGTIAVGLIALWTVFLLTIGRYVADFGLWFAAL